MKQISKTIRLENNDGKLSIIIEQKYNLYNPDPIITYNANAKTLEELINAKVLSEEQAEKYQLFRRNRSKHYRADKLDSFNKSSESLSIRDKALMAFMAEQIGSLK